MASWRDLERTRPDLAASGRTLLSQHGPGLAYLATVRRDGGPRVHPVCPILADGRLWALITPSPKRSDLLREQRYALHTAPDPDVHDEFSVRGRATLHTDPDLLRRVREAFETEGGHTTGDELLFELGIEWAMLAEYGDDGSWPPRYTTWQAAAGTTTPEVIGLDHLYVTVMDLPRSEGFYDRVFEALGFRKGDTAIGGEPHAHYFNRALAYTLRPARSTDRPHDPYAPGLHHVCFQVPSRSDVDRAAGALRALGVEVTAAAEYPEYHDDYYAVFFSDPDGLRLEILARSAHRRQIARHWDEFTVFLNPLTHLRR